jgi:hypothetical protein
LRATTANLESESVRFISDVSHRGQQPVSAQIPAFNKLGHGADEVPIRVSQRILAKTMMLIVIWGIGGFHVVNVTPLGGRFNAESFPIHITDPLLAKIILDGRKRLASRLSIDLDNCRAHPLNASKRFLMEILSLLFLFRPTVLPWPRPPFWLFGHIKTSLAGRAFNDIHALLEPVIEIWNEIQPSELHFVFTTGLND